MKRWQVIFTTLLAVSLVLSACAPGVVFGNRSTLVIYSGRSENLVGPIIEQFEAASGIDVEVRYGSTSEIAATLLEEGDRTPADLFFAQDPGGLGAVIDMLAPLPQETLDKVPAQFRDPEGHWVGISGRARTLVYNTDRLSEADLPEDIFGLTDPEWKGRIGWAPSNASFQTMVTAMRSLWGEERTREWLQGMVANEPVAYDNNAAIVAAVGAGEIDAGLVNHYYLYRFLAEEGESFPARNYYFPSGGPESLVMAAGVGILKTADNRAEAENFVNFMLSPVAQQYFATKTYEYPLVEGVTTHRDLVPFDSLNMAQIDLANLADLQGTIALLRSEGILP
ncbi:MAG: iron ABC transporter substrate-binding protein [Chloroflexi bacterium]|nr:iron ABC transporter substrate-binding protein [Chloroflexota bacterium]